MSGVKQVFKDLTGNECAVCLQTIIHPTVLPCGHIFCFLCVKGIAFQSRCCAMCRREIPLSYFDKPCLLNTPNENKSIEPVFEDGYQWFYEGRNGWWQYDERTSVELENAYQKGEKSCQLLIAGFLYIADFESMVQMRQNDPLRRRKIKRDLATIQKKGVAGLRQVETAPGGKTSSQNESGRKHADISVRLQEAEGCDSPQINDSQSSSSTSSSSNINNQSSNSSQISPPTHDFIDGILVGFNQVRIRADTNIDNSL